MKKKTQNIVVNNNVDEDLLDMKSFELTTGLHEEEATNINLILANDYLQNVGLIEFTGIILSSNTVNVYI